VYKFGELQKMVLVYHMAISHTWLTHTCLLKDKVIHR